MQFRQHWAKNKYHGNRGKCLVAKIQVKFVRPFWCHLTTKAYETKVLASTSKMYQRKHFLLNFTCYHTYTHKLLMPSYVKIDFKLSRISKPSENV